MSWFGDAIAGYYRSKLASADALEAGINSLGTSIGKAIEESRQNSIANQIGSQMANSGDYAPRAGLVSPGTNPLTGDENTITPGTPTGGTAPAAFTGGYKGLQLQTAIDSLKRQNQNTQSEIGLRKAQMGYYGAHTDYLNNQSGINKERADAYARNVANKTNPGLSIQTWSKQATDLLREKAPGWTRVITGGLPFQRGDVGSDGTWKPSATGSMYSYGDNPDDLATNAAPVRDIETLDQQYSKVGQSGGGSVQQPQGQGGGNPPQVRTAQDYANIPSGPYIDPNGIPRTKP